MLHLTHLLDMEALTRMAQRERSDVLASAAAGDEIAFQRLIVAHHDDMARVCSYVTRDDAVAEEAAQAAWSIAWRKIGSVRDPASLRPWLISVAVNEAKQLLRKRRRRAEIEVVAEPTNEAGGIDPATEVAGIDLRAALDRLEPDERALLAMRYVAGFDSTELATALGISPSGVRNRLERLRNRLREELE
jgi:RNA polymerase sigma-70 factor, ECF subfamily